MHYLHIVNKSNRAQEFQCHGYNGDRNVVVKARSSARIDAPDKTSGAVLAVHDGQIGEQAEITKTGFEGNDTVDISNIMGAGGNMTVQQVGDAPDKYKGHATFMQACNAAWHKLDQKHKDQLKGQVFLDAKGNVKRIGPPKNNQALEKFVRTFAQGKTYIGVGAWGNSQGDPGDNAQSKAGKGNKDILIVYSDGNAAPNAANMNAMAMMPELGTMPELGLAAVSLAAAVLPASVPAALSTAPGIQLSNKSGKAQTYYLYDNHWNGNGTAGANFDHPLKSVRVGAHASVHVPLPLTFKGRVQRGTELPATWAEFQVRAADDGAAHGDISLQQGCDGAATIASTAGTPRRLNGFTADIVTAAPAAAVRNKPSGARALDTTVGNWLGGPNQAAIDWEYKMLGHGKAYITGGTGVPDVASRNNCLAVTFY